MQVSSQTNSYQDLNVNQKQTNTVVAYATYKENQNGNIPSELGV